jgi:hypothetical protein
LKLAGHYRGQSDHSFVDSNTIRDGDTSQSSKSSSTVSSTRSSPPVESKDRYRVRKSPLLKPGPIRLLSPTSFRISFRIILSCPVQPEAHYKVRGSNANLLILLEDFYDFFVEMKIPLSRIMSRFFESENYTSSPSSSFHGISNETYSDFTFSFHFFQNFLLGSGVRFLYIGKFVSVFVLHSIQMVY